MVRHIRTGFSGQVKVFVSANLLANGTSKKIITFLDRIGFCSRYETIRRKSYAETADRIEGGAKDLYRKDPHDIVQGLFDNVGYKKGGGFGEKVGYLSMVMLMTARIPKEKLLDYGFYDHPSKPAGLLLLDRT